MTSNLKGPHIAALAAAALLTSSPVLAQSESCTGNRDAERPDDTVCPPLEQITILGRAEEVAEVAGGANLLTAEDLAVFEQTDVVRAMRQVPGVAFQVEDGYGLRPNLSIRGTAANRSSRVTLLEDNVLIAPAPYTAPSAYYFPTFGRVHAVEVLKGPAAITQGPYTVGGAVNLLSTPIPVEAAGHLQGEYGSDDTWRLHGWYGGGNDDDGWGWLVETHQWQSDGYQHIDRSDSDTGLDKQDYLAKLRYATNPGGSIRHVFDLKLQDSEEQSRQSYLGLTDADFAADPLRRYGVSVFDEMDNEHEQVMGRWGLEFDNGAHLALTVYDNEFERAWYKTDQVDFDGSADAQSFSGSSWGNVVRAVNAGASLGGIDADALQAILDGADTPEGSVRVTNNAREYYSRGVQLTGGIDLGGGDVRHQLEAGLRYHEDEEDRLQRSDTYRQQGGQLWLSDRGLEGNAGNRVQDADAWAAWVQDRIVWNRWTFTPGLRFESIELSRVNYDTSGDDPSGRDPSDIASTRRNDVDVWIPGLGVLYDISDSTRLVAGVHKGFAAPGNSPGVDPEESVNYEFGFRYFGDQVQIDLMGFFNDYENLVGSCTNSSGSDCEPGDAFNGEGVHVPGLELSLTTAPEFGDVTVPLRLAWTWMDAEFQTDFDSDFFGEVTAGDPVPYVPDQQFYASAGLVRGPMSVFVSGNYVDSVCTEASCGAFEVTESATLFDASVHYRLGERWELYAIGENITDEIYVAGRQPYGARPNKPRSYSVGASFDF